jgi:hypothetical protein
LASAASRELAAVARGVVGPVGRSREVGPGTFLWAEAADSGWHASAAGHELAHSKAFEWTNAFALPERASVGLHFRSGALPGLLVALEILGWIVAVGGWYRTRGRRSRARSRGVTA